MRNHLIVIFVSLAALFLVSACAQHKASEPVVADPNDLREFRDYALVVDRTAIRDLLSKRKKLRRVLSELGLNDLVQLNDEGKLDKKGQARVRQFLDRLKRGRPSYGDGDDTAFNRSVPKSLRGVSGFSTLQLLEAVADADSGGQRIVSGKIRDYLFDKSAKSGHLSVDTKEEIYLSLKSFVSGVPDIVERYHWDIEVEGAYRVIPHSGDDLDPFPGTVEFTRETLREIKRRGLKYKLYAEGKRIVVRHVYRIDDDGTVTRLPPDHPFYESTEESCIDIMFDRFPPATELPPQFGYCLGRCEHPAVVNTR